MSSARNNRRRRKNKGRFGLLFKLLSVAAVLVALTVGATVFFQVEEVVVSGNARYTPQEVVEASGIQKGDNLFRLNKNAIARTVRESLPYVESLTIRLMLPDGVAITVNEWDAVAVVRGEEGSWLISVGGKLLEQVETADAIEVSGLVPLLPKAGTMLSVGEGESGRLTALLALLAQLEEVGAMDKVSTIDLTMGTQMVLRYDGRFDVILPMNADFRHKLRALQAAVATLESYETGTIDLTQKDYDVLYSPG